ncbi:ski oncogene [Anthonomus grandis grandis]|uniref:ski oncogene n=1 Tax=Anthonomus grandis grandis TaxID=2921223 RepID=UPI0021659B97|nr:ski oncogene [Anthonomus grandis grandis]
MMEVTPHLKSVLKNYQYSATKSLHGPGLSLNPIKNEPSSPGGTSEEEFQAIAAAPFPVQPVPILATSDTSCSERSETILVGESISCFDIGGEKRLCLPQVLNSVLRDFSLSEINRECDELLIFCSRCTLDQINVLKSHGILPSTASTCGLITKTDAERLCSALLFSRSKNLPRNGVPALPFRARKGATSFPVYHECFGEARGLCYPDLYTSKTAKCIECVDCQTGFSPQQFVCHVHRNVENRTVHWGFDSSSHWRSYLHIPDDESNVETFKKILDELRDRYEGKVPFPPPLVVENNVNKRKQIAASELVKDHQAAVSATSDLPLKKQKLDGYLGGIGRIPPFIPPATAAALMQQQIYALEPVYIHQCLQEFNSRNHLSAFKPVAQSIKEQKLRSATAMGLTSRCTTDPPVLQNPDKVVLMSESERFERSYQPNVALAPPTPKKHRYGRTHENSTIASPPQCSSSTSNEHEEAHSSSTETRVKDEPDPIKISPLTPPEKVIDSTVSVLQPNRVQTKYNPEIELSTDTEDSASESSEKHHSDYVKLEEVLKSVNSEDIRDKVIELFKNLSKERERAVLDTRAKDQEKIVGLERRNSELELQNLELRKELEELRLQSENNNRPSASREHELVSSSSIIVHSPISQEKVVSPSPNQKSVIIASIAASVANTNNSDEVIRNTAPE